MELNNFMKKHKQVLNKGKPIFLECGSCNMYHPESFFGDCRDDEYRWTIDEIEKEFGDQIDGGWIEISLEDQEKDLIKEDFIEMLNNNANVGYTILVEILKELVVEYENKVKELLI